VALSEDNIVEAIRANMLSSGSVDGVEVIEVGKTGVDCHSGWSRRTWANDDVVSQPRSW